MGNTRYDDKYSGKIEDVTRKVVGIADSFYDEEYVCAFFRYSLDSLRSVRSRSVPGVDHPVSARFGKSVKYPKALFDEWVNDRAAANASIRKRR